MAQTVKNLPAGFDPWVGKIPWRREWQSPVIFLPGESPGQRSLRSYSPPGHKESHTTEQLTHTRARRGKLTKNNALQL